MSSKPLGTQDAASDRAFLGHPVGLGYLAFTEAWERFSYYGMQTLLVLYMVRQLLLPGHIEHIVGFSPFRHALEHLYGPLSTVALSSAIFGLYTGLVYLTPIGGGILADRWLGRTRAVTLGASLMALGHFLMAFEASFLLALLCLLLGVGCFKGNLASQIGGLYAPEDSRRADAYQIYYMFISGAVILAPLVAGTLGEVYAWHYGFDAAGIGMLIGLAVYRYGRRWLPMEQQPKPARAKINAPLTGTERRTVLLLVMLVPVLAIGTVGNQEIFNAYLLWVPDHINMVFFGRTLPTTWLITVDATASITLLVAVVAFWRLWSRRFTEPSETTKMTLGFGCSVLSLLSLMAAAAMSSGDHKASIGWVLAFEALNSIAFANVLPVGLALYARAAPKSLAGTMIGIYFLHLFLCNNLVGWLGGLVDRLPGVLFWGLHAGLAAVAGLVTLSAGSLLARWLPAMHPQLNRSVI